MEQVSHSPCNAGDESKASRLALCRRISDTVKPHYYPTPFMRDEMSGKGVWQHPQPMPMRGFPCVAELDRVIQQLERIAKGERIYLWTDSENRVPPGWFHLPSIRQGVPPEGIIAEFQAWSGQYPDAKLVVDMRDGVMPPSIHDLDAFLQNLNRAAIILVSDEKAISKWPLWELP